MATGKVNRLSISTRHFIIEYSKKGLSAKLEGVRCYKTGLFYIGVAPKKKVVRPNFFSEGVISRIIFRYMHKDQFLCIFSQIKNNAYLPVHLVHAPRFWWCPSYSFTFSFLCVFFQFLMSCNC